MGRKSKKQYARTISQELHDAWIKLRRKGDPEKMAEELQYSRPVIDRALIYGHITMPELKDKINSFFKNRLMQERGEASELMELADNVEGKR
jgi:hypothetical protein